MNGRTFTRVGKSVLLGLFLLLVISSGVFSDPATYFGVTFPHGDLAFADRVVEYVAASCVRDAHDDPEEALGPPDACDTGCEGCFGCDTNAVSLGFRLSSLDDRGYLVIEFVDNLLTDVQGNDLFVYITNGKPCRVEISADGFHFIFIGETVGYPGGIDIGPYAAEGGVFRFVRLSDVPADEDHSVCPGPSIDAIGAMGPVQEVGLGEAFGSLELQPIGELAISFQHPSSAFLIVLDTSSSMSESIDGSTKIDVAKDVLVDLLGNLPDGSQVGMRTFGGCGKSPLIAPIGVLDRDWLQGEILKLEPRGATPIAFALEQVRKDLAGIGGSQLILLVSDGMETCDGDPVAAARGLIRAGYDLRIHVVGFDVRENLPARDQLLEIARSTGGLYFDAESSEELRQALSIVAPFSYTVYDGEGNEVFAGRIGEAGPDLPTGVYTVVIDTTPPTTLSGVLVEERQTTRITVEQVNGGYQAEIE